MSSDGKRLVVINQASNYLTIGLANAFNRRFDEVVLVTGSIHAQGEDLDDDISVTLINKWQERPTWRKVTSYVKALGRMWILLMTRYRQYEVLFVSAPPMGYLLNLFLPHRFSMVIWDVYPDLLKIRGASETDPIYRVWAAMNRRSFRKSWRIFTISEPMADILSSYVDRSRLIVLPIWSIFQEDLRIPRETNPFAQAHELSGKFVVQYSGNIGVTHNVESLIDIAENLRGDDRILIQIIGRGPRKQRIEQLVEQSGLQNVQVLAFQSDEMFPYSLSSADLGVVILDELVSRGSVPSKTYNLMSFGIPALYISAPDSEIARYAECFDHARCFTTSEVADAAAFVKEIASNSTMLKRMQMNAKRAASNFRRSNAERFVESYFSNNWEDA